MYGRCTHGGVSAGTQTRLQFFVDWLSFEPLEWNKMMANYLLQDVLAYPALDLDVPGHAQAIQLLLAFLEEP